jgi:hypothetical protein
MVRGPLDLHPGLVQVLRAGGPVPDQVVRASSVVPAWQATLTSRRSPQRLPADRDPLVRLRPVHHPRRAPRAARRHRHPLRAAALRQTGSDRGTGVPGPDPQPTVAVVRIQGWMRHSKRCTPGEKRCCRHRAARRNRRGREGPPGNPAHSGTDVSPSRSLRAWMQSPPSPERRTRSCLELVMLTGPGSHTGDRDQVLLAAMPISAAPNAAVARPSRVASIDLVEQFVGSSRTSALRGPCRIG